MIEFLLTQTPLRFLTEGLWRDEAFSLFLAEKSISDIVTTTVLDFNPPLYYFLLHFWTGLFGDSEIAMRSISLLFYAVGVFAVYEIFRLVLKLSHLRTTFYTILFAANPLILYYAFEARMYTMLLCFSLLSTLFLLRGNHRAYLLTMVLGLYTHYFMVLVVASQFLFTLLTRSRKETLHLNPIILQQLYAGLIFLPWVVFFISQNHSIGGEFWIQPLNGAEFAHIPAYLFSGIEKDFYAPVRWDPVLLGYVTNFAMFSLFTLSVGMFFAWTQRTLSKTAILFIVSLLVPTIATIIATDIKPLFLPRYLITASAMLTLSIIIAIDAMPRTVRFAFFGIFIFFIFQFNAVQLEYRDRGRMRDLSEVITPLMNSSDLVYVTNELDLLDAMYYFGKERVFVYGKTYDQIPVYVGKVIIPPTVIIDTYPPFPAKAFIIENSKNFEYRIESNFQGF